jgi:hypothetical protein
MDVIAIKDNKNLHDVNFNENDACVIIKIGFVVTAELPILFYNKVDNKSLGKIGVAIKMHKKNCKIIGHRIHDNSGLNCLIYNPIHDNVILTYTKH